MSPIVIIENSRRCTARQTKAIAYCSQADKSRAPIQQPSATPAMAEARSLDRTEKCIYHAARSSERKYAQNVQPSTISILVLRVLFFFKQKTAYEIGLGIPAEPLFRS